jgi:hypothetical protein
LRHEQFRVGYRAFHGYYEDDEINERWVREIGLGGVDWIRLSQDRNQWQAVVSAVMNLRVLAPRS